MSDYKLVFHINENDRWPFTLRSVRNFIRADASHRAVVVANGGAVRSFSQLEADPNRMARIRGLEAEGVDFVVCAVALEERQVKEELIPDYVRVVPAGIVEIAKLQAEGYGYVKA
ncbi:DsrE family protein [Trueperella pecoris]|uniref:DsrE family protein n=1 Tax=Trueperella pecoris TaxID=2733571 RepID=A0A7M1QZQ8_9ACTO|nr:DsrE family protein [Trueperella pecoris]QOR47373.1 DsrE family protein [Trueperella pecoris]